MSQSANIIVRAMQDEAYNFVMHRMRRDVLTFEDWLDFRQERIFSHPRWEKMRLHNKEAVRYVLLNQDIGMMGRVTSRTLDRRMS